MKNITLLMTLVCAFLWQFAISQSTLKLPTSKGKTVFTTIKNVDGDFIEQSTVTVKEPGNIDGFKTIVADDLYFNGEDYAISVNASQNDPVLYGIYPWSTSTILSFDLPATGATTVRVTDMNGKIVYTNTVHLTKGRQYINFRQDNFQENGIYLYEITSGAFKKTGKMVKI